MMYTIKEKLENNVNRARLAVAGAALSAPMVIGTITSFASETGGTSDDMSSVLIEACSSMASSITSAIKGILPVAIPVVGLGLVVVIGLNVFKRVSSKA